MTIDETRVTTKTKVNPNGTGNGTKMKELRLKVPAELIAYQDKHCSDSRAWIAGAIVQRVERDKSAD